MPAAFSVSEVSERQLRDACAELDRRLRAGERCRAEEVFAALPLFACQEDLAVELIYTEFVAREELGQRPTPEEFCLRFPHWQQRLRRQFQVHSLLRESLQAETLQESLFDSAPEPETHPVFPKHLGQYELLEEIARGGCGVVFRAWQQGLERVVAVKALRPEYGRLLRARQRFCHEARVMAGLRHRHILPVHEIGESQGVIYFSMDYAPAGSLAGRLTDYSVAAGVALLERVARAVHYAHEKGVIHCDLKPSNILLDEQGEPLLSDFGLARLPTRPGDLDGPGQIVGTPAYMAPEQLDGSCEEVGPATDIWALGVILYELLAGRRPFTASNLLDLQEAICDREPIPLPHSGPLEAICRKCLAKEPTQRYATAAEVAVELQGYTRR